MIIVASFLYRYSFFRVLSIPGGFYMAFAPSQLHLLLLAQSQLLPENLNGLENQVENLEDFHCFLGAHLQSKNRLSNSLDWSFWRKRETEALEEEGRKEENKSLAAAAALALTSGFNPRLQAEREDKLCE